MTIDSFMFTPNRNDEIVRILVGLGIKRNVAKVLVYLVDVIEGPSRMIERGTDLRQPEVSVALKWLIQTGWVESREGRAEGKGRPVKMFRLVRTMAEVIGMIEQEKVRDAEHQRVLLARLKEIVLK
ncbi:MAG: ArsR family transcriptional regulator [Methanomicrobiales archaeon]|nr:ArsR family transcriptional regulator [Methanomicrobiales archaeon]